MKASFFTNCTVPLNFALLSDFLLQTQTGLRRSESISLWIMISLWLYDT